MTIKQLKKLLFRAPKNAIIKVNGEETFSISFAENQDNQWTLNIAVEEKKSTL